MLDDNFPSYTQLFWNYLGPEYDVVTNRVRHYLIRAKRFGRTLAKQNTKLWSYLSILPDLNIYIHTHFDTRSKGGKGLPANNMSAISTPTISWITTARS